MAAGDPRFPLKIARLSDARLKVRDLMARPPRLEADPDFEEWENAVLTLIKDLFGAGGYLLRLRQLNIRPISYAMGGGRQWYADPNDAWQSGLKQAEKILGEAIEEAELLSGVVSVAVPVSTSSRKHSNKVFVVHGHDDAARETVARFLERLGIEAIVLHERPTEGRTIVEKLEHYADVDFAVVLLTPDDVGGPKTSTDQQLTARARQNVILELGFFVGRLGRKHVCALHKGELELPSDYLGVGYVPLDAGGGWRLQLAKELKTAKFNVDMNLAIM